MKQNHKIPFHIGLIPDGNRRWARKNNLPIIEGHRQGLQKFSDFAKWCKDAGVKILTVFAFSSENWKRPRSEVEYLMNLFTKYFNLSEKKLSQLQKEKVRIKIIGRKENLPQKLQKAIDKIEKATAEFNKLYLNIALNYGGRWDIVQAAERIRGLRGLRECSELSGLRELRELSEEEFSKYLSTNGLPDIDLIIRAGGEKRLSNFLLWQSSYAEIYFVDKYWPDFTKQDLNAILSQYAKTQRRFGS